MIVGKDIREGKRWKVEAIRENKGKEALWRAPLRGIAENQGRGGGKGNEKRMVERERTRMMRRREGRSGYGRVMEDFVTE